MRTVNKKGEILVTKTDVAKIEDWVQESLSNQKSILVELRILNEHLARMREETIVEEDL